MSLNTDEARKLAERLHDIRKFQAGRRHVHLKWDTFSTTLTTLIAQADEIERLTKERDAAQFSLIKAESERHEALAALAKAKDALRPFAEISTS